MTTKLIHTVQKGAESLDDGSVVEDTTNYSIVHLRAFSPLSVGLPSPGVYRVILLVLPELEPSVLSRLSPLGSQPASLIFDFGRQVTAKELLVFLKQNLWSIQEYHSGFAEPVRIQRELFERLTLHDTRLHIKQGASSEGENPLEDVPEFYDSSQNGG